MLTRTWAPASDPATMRVRVTRSSPPDAAAPVSGRTDYTALDEQGLVDASLAGHTAAFDVIVERYSRRIYQLCYRFVNNHEDARDLTQDVFVRAYRGLRGFRARAALGTWLYRIAVNVSLNRMALKTPQTEALDRREHRDRTIELPDTALLRSERAAEVRAAVARLPRKQRATLILRVYHELPHQEIADILGSTVGAVKANFFHALANLKKLLQ